MTLQGFRRGSLLACLLYVLALLAACAPMPAATPDQVRVEYVHPEAFTDVGSRYLRADSDREVLLAELRAHLARRASALIPAGQTLSVSITDVDMAGGFEPVGRDGYRRVVRNVYPARIDLRFTLAAADGSIVKQGKRELRDSMFLDGRALYRDDPLRYEKALLDRWLEHEFESPRHEARSSGSAGE